MLSQPDSSCVLVIVIVVGVLLVLTADKWNPSTAMGGACSMLSHISGIASAAGASAMKASGGMSARLAKKNEADVPKATPKAKTDTGVKYGAGITSHVRRGAQQQIEPPSCYKSIGCTNLNAMMRGTGPAAPHKSSAAQRDGMWFNIPDNPSWKSAED